MKISINIINFTFIYIYINNKYNLSGIVLKMADVREQRIYCAEQIVVPDQLPNILKHYSKAVIKQNPKNKQEIISFSAKYFKNLLAQQKNQAHDHIEKPDSHY